MNSGNDVKKIRVFFHVINSVKGGSGKSTVSILLAGYYASGNNTKSYIIDLDLRGTSWENNYGKYFRNEKTGSGSVYINSLMDGDDYAREIFSELQLSYSDDLGTTEPHSIYLCMADPNIRDDIDEVEIDLFENTICKIIRQIYIMAESDTELKEIHIILDMPPSYERHAERIFKHFLFDIESSFRKSFQSFEQFDDYKVELIMLSALSPAHIELNKKYVIDLFKEQVISSLLNDFIEKDRFCIQFWGNDVASTMDALEIPDLLHPDHMKALLDYPRRLASEYYGSSYWHVIRKAVNHARVIPHLQLISSNYYFKKIVPEPDKKIIILPNDARTAIDVNSRYNDVNSRYKA